MEGLGFIEVCVWSWAPQSERTSSRGPGTAFAEGPAQRETAKAEVHGGAAAPRARRGAKAVPNSKRRPRDAEAFQINSDPRMASTCLGPQGSGRSLCSWWQGSGAGSPAWAAFRRGFVKGSVYCGSRGAAPGRVEGRRPPSMGVGDEEQTYSKGLGPRTGHVLPSLREWVRWRRTTGARR